MRNFNINKIDVKKTKIVFTSEITINADNKGNELKRCFTKGFLMHVLAGSSPNNLNMVDEHFNKIAKNKGDVYEKFRNKFDLLLDEFEMAIDFNPEVKSIKTY